MKFQYLTLLLMVFSFQCMKAAMIDRTSLNKRDTALMLEPTTAIIENNKRSTDTVFINNKRCGGHDDVDCLLDSVVDLLTSILGGHSGHYDGKVVDVVHTLVKAVRQLLHALDLHGRSHHGGGGLDGLLGSLLGGNHDDDDDFGCGCDGDGDALIDHLIHTIQDLLDQLLGCKDGVIPQLVDAVADLLENLGHEGGVHHNKKGHKDDDDDDHHHQGGHQGNSHHGGKHDGDCDGDVLGLDCLLNSVTELVDSLLNGGDDGHRHSHGGHHDNELSDLVTQVVQLLHHLLNALDLDSTLDLKGGLDLHLGDSDNNDFGCGCDGDHGALISHLIKTLEHALDQLAGCGDDDNRGLIGQLIKTVKQLLKTLGSSKHDHDIRQRFDARRRRKQRTTTRHSDGLDLGLIEGTLDTIEELLDRLVGECDDSLLGQIKDVVDRILEGIKKILACLRKGLLNDLLHLVRALVNDVAELLTRCDDDDGLAHILDALVHTIKSLVSGCNFLGLIDLHRLVLHL